VTIGPTTFASRNQKVECLLRQAQPLPTERLLTMPEESLRLDMDPFPLIGHLMIGRLNEASPCRQ